MKVFLIVLLIVTSVLCSESDFIEYGQRSDTDNLLYEEVVKKTYSLSGTVKADFVYPPLGSYDYGSRIRVTCIRIKDLWNNGAKFTLASPKPPTSHAVIEFKSKPLKGLNFKVEVYGYIEKQSPILRHHTL